MASTITADNGVSSGSAGLKSSADSSGVLALATGTGTTAVTIDSSQRVGIGTASPTNNLTIGNGGGGNDLGVSLSRGATTNFYEAYDGTKTMITGVDASVGYIKMGSLSAHPVALVQGNGIAAYIDTSKNFLVGTSNSSFSSGVGLKLNTVDVTAPAICITQNTSVGGTGSFHIYNTNATNNGYRFYTMANGGIQNFSGNNVNLSDVRTKTNIEVSGGYLAKICAIPVKLFNYKDEPEGEQRTLGVIAQDVESVAPELVDKDGWVGKAPEGEEPLKAVYTTDLMFALMKCIQEQQAIIEQLRADVETLKAKP